jgi:hypothetical protein
MTKKDDLSVAQPIAVPQRCTAHRKNGDQCKRAPIRGGTVCTSHGGGAPAVREKARRRLLASQDWLMSELLRIAKSSKNEGVKLKAIRDALDRAGLSATQIISVEAVHRWDETFDGVEVQAGQLAADTLSDEDAAEIAALNATAEVEAASTRKRIGGGQADVEDDDLPAVLRGVVVDRSDPDRAVVIPAHLAEALRRQGLLGEP